MSWFAFSAASLASRAARYVCFQSAIVGEVFVEAPRPRYDIEVLWIMVANALIAELRPTGNACLKDVYSQSNL